MAIEFGSLEFGDVALKEKINGWQIKLEKNVALMGVSNASLEGSE